ncbi:hypothetical protein BKA70DRAFT_1215905 [Coprinopsis sp. MPI-PUGE-AT-0042]|nr:hypothetical protein BKA70DRAFT_1215905 [Coprinopsis sp. MPI-PUGE-AT-0042]
MVQGTIMEILLCQSSPSEHLSQPSSAEVPAQVSTNPASSSRGVLAPVFSWAAGVQDNQLDSNEDGYGGDQAVDGKEWEDVPDNGAQEDLEDQWDLQDNDEVLAYDDMYQDWYLYDE